MTYRPNSLVDVLQWRAQHQSGQTAYRFLTDGENNEVVLSYEQLDQRARSIGALLQANIKAGDRAILLFPPGSDFIAAYLGCLYAKVLAIPSYPPHPARVEISLPILRRIAADAGAAAMMLSTSLFEVINSKNSIHKEFGNIKLIEINVDKMDYRADQWESVPIESNDKAFLQYTSGSTTTPKGVILSHSNLIHNMEQIERCFEISKEDHGVIWLPPYHDMGLIGGILQPIYSGIPVTLMPHMIFLQRPLRWLQTISRFRATVSGGPNFAYNLCIKKIKPEQKEQLDLSSWKLAFTGAEPVYHKTLEQFADYFSSCGFRREAFLPCYGLAESTLFVVGGRKGEPPKLKHLLNKGLEENQVIFSSVNTDETRTLVSNGRHHPNQTLKIVNVDTLIPCQPNEVGEIWVHGPCVGGGYWNQPAETEFTFRAHFLNDSERSFLRTGDLGFLHEGELYITGRLKNLIISDGKNHYPHDIERTVEASHPLIRSSGSAVFSISNGGTEDIIVVAELEHQLLIKSEEITTAIREAVSLYHGLHVRDIKLAKPGGIPRTTSGKIRHFLCKQNYLAGNLKEIEAL